FDGTAADLHVEVQQVAHDSRVHLDIEADDIDAEAARLEALGAKRIGFVKRWWVMEAPTGQRFCVVRMRERANGAPANAWD
ncbi:VOC family protein, partial [Tolypothrix campylonemoides VB511288]